MLEDAITKRHALENMRIIFKEADTDHSGEVDWKEFQIKFRDPRVQYYFRKIGVHVESECALGLFELFDFDGSGKINLDEFVMACSHYSGVARSIDLVRMHYDFRKLRKEIAQKTL